MCRTTLCVGACVCNREGHPTMGTKGDDEDGDEVVLSKWTDGQSGRG